MATTAKTYRLGKRNQRYMTKLSTFKNGMYLTNQIIPEGYAKVMVNYDIDATGSHIKPKPGRKLVQDIEHVLTTPEKVFAPIILNDYIHADKIVDVGDSYVHEEINLDVVLNEESYGCFFNTDTQTFNKISFPTSGAIKPGIGSAFANSIGRHKIENAYAFDKPIINARYNTFTVCNNDLYTISYDNTTGVNSNKVKHLKLIYNLEEDKAYINNDLSVTLNKPNALEATSSGFNLLLDSPYKMEDTQTGTFDILGALAYPTNDYTFKKPLLTLESGKECKIKVNYTYGSSTAAVPYKVYSLDLTNKTLWDDSDFEEILSGTITPGNNWTFNLLPKHSKFLLRIVTNPGTANEDLLTVTFSCNVESLKRVSLMTPKLTDATKMISWYSYIGVYNVPDYKNTIFFSAPENVGYFPFPNNILTFDNEVLAVHNYLDFLLVITIDSIYLVTIGNTIMESIQKKIMSNVTVTEVDAMNAVVLNNQFFVKTSDQFYVFKPNNYTSDATDLKNYVISTAIDNLTKNFTKEIVDIINHTYKKELMKLTRVVRNAYTEAESTEHEGYPTFKFVDFEVVDMISYTMNQDVHYVYRLHPKLNTHSDMYIGSDQKGYLDLHLIYDSIVRSWRLYLESQYDEYNKSEYSENFKISNTLHKPYKHKTDGTYYEFYSATEYDDKKTRIGLHNLIIHKEETLKGEDFSKYRNYKPNTDNFDYGNTTLNTFFDNNTYIDTGYIALEDMFTKRFRELQFNLTNSELTPIPFHVNFKIDGQTRIDDVQYRIEHIDTHPGSPRYGHVFISPVEVENLMLYGTTEFTYGEEAGTWTADFSKFTDINMLTIRFSLLGKGRHASFQLLNTSCQVYELSDVNWVYRTMSGR